LQIQKLPEKQAAPQVLKCYSVQDVDYKKPRIL
jgi:hypothetical protein